METKLDYATPGSYTKPAGLPRPGIATAALVVGCTALLSDAVFAIGIFQHDTTSPTALAAYPVMVCPVVGLFLAAFGRPVISSRAALGLATSLGSGLLGFMLLIAFAVENMPQC